MRQETGDMWISSEDVFALNFYYIYLHMRDHRCAMVLMWRSDDNL